MTTNECQTALTSFARKELANARGLPPRCSPDEVAAVLSPRGSPTEGTLGDRTLVLRHYHASAYKEPVRGWFDGDRLVLIDVEYPEPSEGWQAFVTALGEPTAKLDFAWHIHTLPGAEWVYAERGIAVVVKPDPGLILRLALFSPTSADRYERELRLVSKYREEP